MSRFWFLSRFWGNARKEGSRILILRSAIASTSHLKRCHLVTFSWQLESKRTRARGRRNRAKNMPCLKTQIPKFKIETPESCNSVATRLPCANIASGSFSLSHFLLSPLKTKRGKRAMFSSSSHFEDEPLLKLSQLPCFYPQYTHRSQLERSRTVVMK